MSTIPREQLSDVIRSTLEASIDPSMASADWLVRDIDKKFTSAFDFVTNERITISQLHQAKSAFKTMRILGETSSDRRLAAKLYAGTIAAALVRHNCRITRQSDDALRRALHMVLDDTKLPDQIRDLAGGALCILNDRG